MKFIAAVASALVLAIIGLTAANAAAGTNPLAMIGGCDIGLLKPIEHLTPFPDGWWM